MLVAYLAAIAVGGALIVAAAITQPYNQNELQQVNAYRFGEIERAVSGTRQPPLGPALGVLARRTLGVGQIQQRLESIVPAIGALVVLSALFWRLRLGLAGAAAMWVVATAPLMVRYSAYARPYALPLFLMVTCTYVLWRWLETGRRRHLAGVLATSVLLPLARVPEPTVFLCAVAVALAVLGGRGRHPWRRLAPPLAAVSFALVAVAYPMYRTLVAATAGFATANPAAVLRAIGPQVDGLVATLPRVLAASFPWWPASLAVVVAAVAAAPARRWLATMWPGAVLAVPPATWAVYYHLAIRTPADGAFGLVYRDRFAYFFVPALAFAVAAVARQVVDPSERSSVRTLLGLLLVALLVGQAPATAAVLREHDTADWAAAARLVAGLPDDAVVLYDNVAPLGSFRQAFYARPRYLHTSHRVMVANFVSRRARGVSRDRPLYVLLLGPSRRQPGCGVESGAPIAPRPGWRLRAHDGRFSLFEQVTPEAPARVAATFLDYAGALPPRCGYAMTAAAAALLARYGDEAGAHAVLRDLLAGASPRDRPRIADFVTQRLPGLAAGLDRPPR